MYIFIFFFFNDTATTEIYTLSLHDALPISINEIQVDTNNMNTSMEKSANQIMESGHMAEKIRHAFKEIKGANDEVNCGTSIIFNSIKESANKIDEIRKYINELYIQVNNLSENTQQTSAASEEQLAGIQEISNS